MGTYKLLIWQACSLGSPDMTIEKSSEREHGDNSTVQTAAMGQIPRSTERILVDDNLNYI